MILEIPFWIDTFKIIPGAFSVAEAFALYHAVKDNYDIKEKLTAVDLGSALGKSSLPASVALSELGNNALEFWMIDPIFAPTNALIYPSCTDPMMEQKVNYTIKNAAPLIKPNTRGGSSIDFLKEYEGLFGYVLIDSGDHGPELLAEEIPLIEEKTKSGSLLFFHDYGSQFTAVTNAHDWLVDSGKWRKIDLHYPEIRDFIVLHNLEDNPENDSWHKYPNVYSPEFLVGLIKI